MPPIVRHSSLQPRIDPHCKHRRERLLQPHHIAWVFHHDPHLFVVHRMPLKLVIIRVVPNRHPNPIQLNLSLPSPLHLQHIHRSHRPIASLGCTSHAALRVVTEVVCEIETPQKQCFTHHRPSQFHLFIDRNRSRCGNLPPRHPGSERQYSQNPHPKPGLMPPRLPKPNILTTLLR